MIDFENHSEWVTLMSLTEFYLEMKTEFPTISEMAQSIFLSFYFMYLYEVYTIHRL